MKRLFTVIALMCAILAVQAQPMGGMGGMRGGMGGGMPMGGMRMGGGMPMGMMTGAMGDEKPFFELESDSIVQACLYDLPFILDAKKSEKFGKIVKMEYEEVCRTIQMEVISNLINNQIAAQGGMGGGMGFGAEQKDLDQSVISEQLEPVLKRYAKKYRKMLDDEQYEQWQVIEDKRYGRGLGYLLAHVCDNTSIDF